MSLSFAYSSCVIPFLSLKSAPAQNALSDVEFTMRTRVLMENGGTKRFTRGVGAWDWGGADSLLVEADLF